MTESKENNETAGGPHIPDWLTEELFVNILKEKFPEFQKIQEFDIVPAVGTGENYMTILLRVNIDIELKDGSITQTSYIVKLQPKSIEMQGLLKIWQVFEKEENTYTKYLPAFEKLYKDAGKEIKFAPNIILLNSAISDPAIIMEDLRIRNFKNAKRQDGLDIEHTKAALEKLAQFHAASACYYENNGPYPDMYLQCLCGNMDLYEEYRNNMVNLFCQNLELYDAKPIEEKFRKFAAEVPDQFQAVSKPLPEEFNVLNHGDCWSNNIMFQYNAEGKIIDTHFVDLQMSRYGSPAQDLNYLLLSSTSLEHKVKKFDYFLYFYHDKLVENLKLLNYTKPIPTLKKLHIEMLKYNEWIFAVLLNVMPVVLFEPSKNANSENLISENEEGQNLKIAMFRNKTYAAHVTQLIPWLDKRGLLEYLPNLCF
ncbi:uncharacterized protein LOC119682057 [Teleopsis dalmanni]|nr:uncharacterized protein LOC119682057 [Teleopsis dalmanni]